MDSLPGRLPRPTYTAGLILAQDRCMAVAQLKLMKWQGHKHNWSQAQLQIWKKKGYTEYHNYKHCCYKNGDRSTDVVGALLVVRAQLNKQHGNGNLKGHNYE